MLKSYYIEQPLPLEKESSPIDALMGRFRLPELFIASYIGIPQFETNENTGVWVTLFQDPYRSRMELALLCTLYLNLIIAHTGSQMSRHGLTLLLNEDPIGKATLSEPNSTIWMAQIGVEKIKSSYAIRLSEKTVINVADFGVDLMQTYITDYHHLTDISL